MQNAWRWAGARSVGTSHVRSGLPCQDYAVCMEFETGAGNVFVGAVSDGAGTASHAEAGARMVCSGFLRAAAAHFKNGLTVDEITDDVALEWMDEIRERISAFSRTRDLRPRDCAATLVGMLAGPRSSVLLHVGDGAAVVREVDSADWFAPSWPFHGEYASTTIFVTDDPMPDVSLVHLPVTLEGVALFSDGIERLVLDHAHRTAHGPFFDRMISPIKAGETGGHDRHLSRALRNYLDSPTICDRTDDDKSLILAARR